MYLTLFNGSFQEGKGHAALFVYDYIRLLSDMQVPTQPANITHILAYGVRIYAYTTICFVFCFLQRHRLCPYGGPMDGRFAPET